MFKIHYYDGTQGMTYPYNFHSKWAACCHAVRIHEMGVDCSVQDMTTGEIVAIFEKNFVRWPE